MSLVVLLRHPKESRRYEPVRLTLIGSTLLTQVGKDRPRIQNLPDREIAKANLERSVRANLDIGYRVLERSEVAGDEVEPIADPLEHFFRFEERRQRALIDFEEGPIELEEIEEAVARLAALAPRCIDHLRDDNVPGGLLGEALAGAMLPSVKALVYSASLSPENWRLPLDDLSELIAPFPALERACASGRFTLREANHDALRELHLHSEQMLPGTIAAISDGSLPALTTLGLVLGDEHGLDRATAAALQSLDAPRLQAIQVAEIEDVTAFLDELTDRPLPASWVMLYAHGSIADEDALLAVLRERAPVLASIAMLGLPLADDLSEGGVAEVKALLPSVVDVSDLPKLWAEEMSEKW